MKILAHRGYWKTEDDKNSIIALTRAFERGWGIETDIRDYMGKLVISHNPADENSPILEELLEIYNTLPIKPLLALNVKADGLYLLLPEIMNRFGMKPEHYFLFDMSLPEQYTYIDRGYRVFTRSSEFEPQPAFIEQSDGFWLDQFIECDHIIGEIDNLLDTGKEICIVSPELHGRSNAELWDYLVKKKELSSIYLCTDKPDEAEEYFK